MAGNFFFIFFCLLPDSLLIHFTKKINFDKLALKSNKFLPFDANLKVLKSVDTGISFEYAKKKLTRQVTRYDNDDAVY